MAEFWIVKFTARRPGGHLSSSSLLCVARPGLAVVEVAAADDETAFAVQELLAVRWGIASADRTPRDPGESDVRLRCFLDLRQELDPGRQAEGELDPVTG